ncbi:MULTISPECIES: ABC transporter ATP-binding protein [unclassified Diaminobutyricimonas]|uniref:ABC transporter ATP-binding protein n=1 Tax=unclassified Diaminobutyricimonas TaxID=2643261 RepID=UPI0012F4EAFA|nr:MULTISPECIES: ABC transporter ATP-binding protein [unclassified Diaminobutyricimonas]
MTSIVEASGIRDAQSQENAPLLEVSNLAVRLPTGERDSVQAVRDVSLTIHPGERVGIVGESGSGKSITGRAIAGLLPQSKRVLVEGSIRYRGKEMVGASRSAVQDLRRSRISMIFQDPLSFLNPTMRIERQVDEALPVSVKQGERGHLIDQYLELAGLNNVSELRRRYPFELSGGMRQRVLIAIALAKSPELIIADEPTTALDVTVQAKVLQSLSDGVSRLGTTLMMITHDLAVVSQMCDRVYVLYRGEVVESGDTAKVFGNPQHPYTAALIRSVVSLSDDTNELHSS